MEAVAPPLIVGGSGTITADKVRVKRFANGDTYNGVWKDGFPDGEGTYEWADGSSYQGMWYKGLKHGNGKYIWPNGAVFSGEWRDGFMHGRGTFSAPDGTTYQGGWAWDLKHGLGKKVYANGDVYEGLWNRGKAEGPGRYRWADGNEYDGEWKGGKMHGKGTFLWKTGERYDGEWLHGQEHGIGVFAWADGSKYDGFWHNGVKHGIGIYWQQVPHPGIGRRHSVEAPLQEAAEPGPSSLAREGGEPNDCVDGACTSRSNDSAERPIQAPSLSEAAAERWHSQHAANGNLGSVVIREYDHGKLQKEQRIGTQVLESILRVPHRTMRKMGRKKALQLPGERIFKGHQSYDLMISLQQGIRYSIGKVTPQTMPPEIRPFHCSQKDKVDFPRKGSQTTPPHSSADFLWKDYAPMVFRKLRELFQVDSIDYMLSLCGDQALRELKTPGKSGSVFYISHDFRYMVKTMRKEETRMLIAMLPKYFRHASAFPHTMITRFYGVHRITPRKGRKVRFVVMGNVMQAFVPVHKTFDLKGSTIGRKADNPEKAGAVLKDLDLDCTFKLEEGWRECFVAQLQEDCRFLESSGVMDYSLLLGVHFRQQCTNGDAQTALDMSDHPLGPISENMERAGSAELGGGLARRLSLSEAESPTGFQYLRRIAEEHGIEERWIMSLLRLAERRLVADTSQAPDTRASEVLAKAPSRSESMRPMAFSPGATDELAAALHQPSVRLGSNIAAVLVPNDGSDPVDVVLLFGIIDILQEYDARKKVEHQFKSLRYNGSEISAISPRRYSQRFQDFLKRAFQ